MALKDQSFAQFARAWDEVNDNYTAISGHGRELVCDTSGRLYVVVSSIPAIVVTPPTPIELSWDDSAALERQSTSKASAGDVYQVDVTNNEATQYFFQIHNSAAALVGGEVPLVSLPLLASGGLSIFYGPFDQVNLGATNTIIGGKTFSTGITWAVSTTVATWTDPGLDPAWVNLGYV